MADDRQLPNSDDRHLLDELERVVNVTSNYTLGKVEDLLIVDSTAGVVTITLPLANRGRRVTILRKAGTNNVVIVPQGTDTVNGAASLTITTSYSPVRLKAIKGLGFLGV